MYWCVCTIILLPKCVGDLFFCAHACVSVMYVFVLVYLYFRAYACVWVSLCVSVGARVKPWVWVGAVSVSAAQRAEYHRAARHRAAMFDLQVDSVVVDLQRSCRNRRKMALSLSSSTQQLFLGWKLPGGANPAQTCIMTDEIPLTNTSLLRSTIVLFTSED